MRRAVLDASVVLKWFSPQPEDGDEAAAALAQDVRSRHLRVLAPSILFLEVLNVVARGWRLGPSGLERIATLLEEFPFEVEDPPLSAVAGWAARGLTAYDAAYVALAERHGFKLITADRGILEVAGDIAQPLIDPDVR